MRHNSPVIRPRARARSNKADSRGRKLERERETFRQKTHNAARIGSNGGGWKRVARGIRCVPLSRGIGPSLSPLSAAARLSFLPFPAPLLGKRGVSAPRRSSHRSTAVSMCFRLNKALPATSSLSLSRASPFSPFSRVFCSPVMNYAECALLILYESQTKFKSASCRA